MKYIDLFKKLDCIYKRYELQYRAKINALINEIADTQTNIQHINKNCFIVRFSVVHKHNIFDVSFYNWKQQAIQLQKLIENRPINECITFLQSIYENDNKGTQICRYKHKNEILCFDKEFLNLILIQIINL